MWWTFEVVYGESVDTDTAYVQFQAYFEYLGIPIGQKKSSLKETYASKCDVTREMTLLYLLVLRSGVATVAVHDEGNMPWNWASRENVKKDTLSCSRDPANDTL